MPMRRLVGLSLLGVLSMTFAEVFSGSSRLWFIDAWAWLIAFPLYWSHTLLFLNLAIRTQRTTVSHLYLWGFLFGLYESWVTKVIWAGYLGSPPALGQVGGIAVAEFITLTMVWHPLFSFVIPVLVYEIVTVDHSVDNKTHLLPSHSIRIEKNRTNSKLWGIVILFGAAFLSFNSQLSPMIAGITSAGSVLIIILLVRLGRRWPGACSMESVTLGKRGLVIVITYVILLYGTTLPILLPERIPPPETIILTLGIYLVATILIILTPRVTENGHIRHTDHLYTWSDIQTRLLTFVLLSVVFCLVPLLSLLLTVIGMLFMIFCGLPIFIMIVGRLLFRRTQQSTAVYQSVEQ